MTLSAFDADESLIELRSRLIWHLGLALIGFGILGAWYLMISRDIPLIGSGLLCLVIALGRITQLVVDKRPALASYLLVGGSLILLIIGMWLFSNPWLPYLGLICVFVSAMLINQGGWFTAGIIAGVSILLNVIGGRFYPLLELTVSLGLAAVSSWLSAYTLFTAVHWYSAMQ